MPIRTYTVRAVRTDPVEVDVDFVLHGATGPASAWAEAARVGDEVVLVGRTRGTRVRPAASSGSHPPVRPPCSSPATRRRGPAICAIAESLPAGLRAHVLMEVPSPADALELSTSAGVQVTWLPRHSDSGGAPRGLLLTRAVVAAVTELAADLTPGAEAFLDDIDVDTGLLWEVPLERHRATGIYAWLAGEAGVVKGLRRHLVQEVGLPRTSVAFMGYWREGRESD